MKNRNQLSEWKIRPEIDKPTILAWGSFKNFISGEQDDPPKERCPIKSL